MRQNHPSRPEVLVVAPRIPTPEKSSGDLRFFRLLGIMCRLASVTLLTVAGRKYRSALPGDIERLSPLGLSMIVTGVGYLEEVICRQNFDLALFEYYQSASDVAAPFREMQPHVPVLIDTVDIQFFREASAVRMGTFDAGRAARNKALELSAYRQSDGLLVVSPEDEAALKMELPEIRAWQVPNIMDLRQRTGSIVPNSVLFVGGFRHKPNVDAVHWFVNDIWPLILEGCPEARFTIVGSHPPESVSELSKVRGVECVGFVPSTHEYLDRAAVSVAPLRIGAGMKGKVTEALASALPVVSTPIGAQGFTGSDGENLRVAEDPAGFAKAVLDVFAHPDKAAAMGRRGQELVARTSSPAVIEETVKRILAETCRRGETVPDEAVVASRRRRYRQFFWRTLPRRYRWWLQQRLVSRVLRPTSTS